MVVAVKKNFILTMIFTLIVSFIVPSFAFAQHPAGQDKKNNPNKKHQVHVKKDMANLETYANDLTPYVSINENGTIYLNPKHEKEVDTPEYVLTEITAWVNFVNEEVQAGKAFVTEDLEVHWYETEEDIAAREAAAAAESLEYETMAYDGTNGIYTYWWGYRVYLDSALSKQTSYYLTGAALFTTTVNGWISKMPSAPTWLIKGILTTLAGAYAFVGQTIKYKNNGYGVYLRFTGRFPYLVYTGCYSQ